MDAPLVAQSRRDGHITPEIDTRFAWDGRVWEYIDSALFPPDHPYSWETIGSMDDLSAATLDDVRNWFKAYYGPNNAVLAIAGDVNADEAFARVRKYFGDIPAVPPITRPGVWIPRHAGTRRMTMQDRVPQARFYRAWTAPQWGSTDAQQLAIATQVLGGDKNSRLYQRLVYRDRLASDVSMGSVAASGGYWISMAANEIWASPTTRAPRIPAATARPWDACS